MKDITKNKTYGESKKTKQELAQIRFNEFINDVVPALQLRYNVLIFTHHIKIMKDTGSTISYDYYPKGQKLTKMSNATKNLGTIKYSIEEFTKLFLPAESQ